MKQDTAFGILKTGRNIFLTGSAGAGKTYILNKYTKYLKERKINLTTVAPTGIAASHIGGMTIHSFFGIGIRENADDYFVDSLLQKEFLQKRMRNLKVLIVDEVSMVSPELFASMDKILRAFKEPFRPFGGVQLILSGDFFQLPPVSRETKSIKFAWQTKNWQEAELRICYLEEQFRQEDGVLLKILNEIRSGAVSEESLNVFRSCYQKELPEKFKAAKLYTHNVDVDRINKKELDALDGVSKIFEFRGKGSKKNIERILNSSLLVDKLELKKDALVIFIKNNYEAGYINGSLGKVVGFDNFSGAPIVKLFSGRKITADRVDWQFENEKGEIKAIVSQIPLRLAWAITIHKSQGMTLDAAEIDLSKTFESGQGYVALSRVKSIEGLKLIGLNKMALQVDEGVAKSDRKFKEDSRLTTIKFHSFSEEEAKKMFDDFIIKNGGSFELKEILKNRKKLKEEKKFEIVKKESTLKITKKLLGEKKSVEEIAKERKLSSKTVLGHIEKISKIFPDFNLYHLVPEDVVLTRLQEATQKIKEKNNPDDFLEDGRMRMKAVFEFLNGGVSYEEIKLAFIFLGLGKNNKTIKQ
jgi:GTPase SAR1 family protein